MIPFAWNVQKGKVGTRQSRLEVARDGAEGQWEWVPVGPRFLPGMMKCFITDCGGGYATLNILKVIQCILQTSELHAMWLISQ